MDGASAQAAEARRLRSEEQLSVRQIQQRLGVTRQQLSRWLRGLPPPAWTARPNAKDDLRQRAVTLRGQGWTVTDIALELGVAKSTAWRWVRHLPLDGDSERAQRKRAHSKLMTDALWSARRTARDERRAGIIAGAVSSVGALTARELVLIGAVLYWCEGTKAKPWRAADYQVTFINSDPMLLALFLRFLEAVGVQRGQLTYRVSIHESADADSAAEWWATKLGLPRDRFKRATLKRHRPVTNRKNVGDGYHGCLIVRVPKSRELYWRIEGIVTGIDCASPRAGPHDQW